MKHGVTKAVFTALISGGVLAGCATTMDMGGPLGHYRYHYDSRIVYDTTPAVVYSDGVAYREPAVAYREPAVVYREPAVVDRYPTTVTSYYDHKR